MIFSLKKTLRFNGRKSLLIFAILSGTQNLSAQNKLLLFYRDTSLIYKDYRIDITNTYLRKALFVKSTIEIQNNSSQYLILDRFKITVLGSDGIAHASENKEDLIYKPKGSYKHKLKFGPAAGDQKLSFLFQGAWVPDQILATYAPMDLEARKGEVIRAGNISIEVLNVSVQPDFLWVRVRIYYLKDDFLAINFQNIYTLGNMSGQIKNWIRPNHRMHHRKTKYLEMATLKFPLAPGERTDKIIRFENVFTEYSLKPMEDFNLQFSLPLDTYDVERKEPVGEEGEKETD